jgi:putative oxidoreductase
MQLDLKVALGPNRTNKNATGDAMLNTKTAPYAVLLLRVSLGLLFLAHAATKVFIITLPGFVGFFASLGLPPLLAYAIVALETWGGLALILGIYAPLVALTLAIEVLATIVLVHAGKGWQAGKGGWEFPALWTVALIAICLLGDGPYALRPLGTVKRP